MLPTHRVSKARRGNRRSHDALTRVQLAVCPNCGSSRHPHAACPRCGYVRPGLTLKLTHEEE